MSLTASNTSTRTFKRILQACENCHRKKTRCPGEKPGCSNCTRLQQQCKYPGDEADGTIQQTVAPRNIEDRLAQLEEKLDLILEKPVLSARQDSTPHTYGNGNGDGTASSPSSPLAQRQQTSYSLLLPTTDGINKAIEIYFMCSHRQPIWLFDSANQLSYESPEELILVVLALSTQYAPSEFAGLQMHPPATYNDASRSLIMLKIANSTIDLSTIHALILLAFSNFVAGDQQLACFHISMLGNLLQCSGLDCHVSSEPTKALEEHRRVFWSFRVLGALCGLQVQVAFPLEMHAPRYLALEETLRKTTEQAPSFPQESETEDGQMTFGIFAHMVRSATIWEEVRVYISRCAQGQAKPPWHTDSGYTAISSHLLDMECAFPQWCRYDNARFQERSATKITKNRHFWLPWMKIQITYHTIHSVLNHPFLYATRTRKPRPGPNGFWKTSTDLALLHSTWVARLIEMAKKKDLQLADPYFAHAAAISATLHLYWSRVSNPKICTPAADYLVICRSFLSDMASHWPVCRSLSDEVDSLVESASQLGNGALTTVSTHTSLMWSIMDFASPRRPRNSGQTLFHSSMEDILRTRASSHDQMTLEDPEPSSPPDDYRTSIIGGYAAPPDWFAPLTQSPEYSTRQVHDPQSQQINPAEIVAEADISGEQVQQQQPTFPDSTAWTWRPDDPSATYDPWSQFYDRAGPAQGWWDYGNL